MEALPLINTTGGVLHGTESLGRRELGVPPYFPKHSFRPNSLNCEAVKLVDEAMLA